MSFDRRELAIVGHWPSTSRMPERYDRSVCASELMIRNTIAQNIASGWEIAPAYHLPTTVTGHTQIGKTEETPLLGTQLTQTDTPIGELREGDAPLTTEGGAQIESSQSTTDGSKNSTGLPKTEVLALGSQALGNPIISPNTS